MDDIERQVLAAFKSAGALHENTHVVLNSGKHSNCYVNGDVLFVDTTAMLTVCSLLAEELSAADVDVIIAPAIGGTVLAFLIADALRAIQGRRVYPAYAEKDGKGFIIRRGFDELIIDHPRVLVVEDVLTTGGSLQKVVDAVRALDGVVTHAAALWNRGGVTKEMVGVQRLVSLCTKQFESWPADECPLCAQGEPININVGHGKEFLKARQRA